MIRSLHEQALEVIDKAVVAQDGHERMHLLDQAVQLHRLALALGEDRPSSEDPEADSRLGTGVREIVARVSA
jgi:hypothetical protein